MRWVHMAEGTAEEGPRNLPWSGWQWLCLPSPLQTDEGQHALAAGQVLRSLHDDTRVQASKFNKSINGYKSNGFLWFTQQPSLYLLMFDIYQTSLFRRGAKRPDCPYSLYEGTAGAACYLADLLNPDKAEFPFLDPFQWKIQRWQLMLLQLR